MSNIPPMYLTRDGRIAHLVEPTYPVEGEEGPIIFSITGGINEPYKKVKGFYKNSYYLRQLDIFQLEPFVHGKTGITNRGTIIQYDAVLNEYFYIRDSGFRFHYILTGIEYRFSSVLARFAMGVIKKETCDPIYMWNPAWNESIKKRGFIFSDSRIKTAKQYIEHLKSGKVYRSEICEIPSSFPSLWGTGAHLNSFNSKLISYYPDNRSIFEDRAELIKPGKYLKKYFPELTDDEIRIHSACITSHTFKLKTFGKFSNIYKYYKDMDDRGIAESCMSKSKNYWSHGRHPLEVYHDSDIGLVVMFNSVGDALGRALYNKRNMEYPMIYGQWERMKVLLDKEGFKHGSLDGAVFSRIDLDSGRVLMPYIDGHRVLCRSGACSTNVEINYDSCTVDQDGAYEANCFETAFVYLEDRESCYECGDYLHSDHIYRIGDSDEVYCECCYDNYTVSVNDHGGNTFTVHQNNTGTYIEIDGDYYLDPGVAEGYGFVYSEFHGQWLHRDDSQWVSDEDWVSEAEEGYTFVDVDGIGMVWVQEAIDRYHYDGEAQKFVEYESDVTCPIEDLKAHYMERPQVIHSRVWFNLPDREPADLPLPARLAGIECLEMNEVAA